MDTSILTKLQQVSDNTAPTLVDCLTQHAKTQGDEQALIFLTDGEEPMEPMTFAQLHQASCQFAAGILLQAKPGDRVILLFQSSYDFVISFFGCMYAGVISIPLPMPGRRKNEWQRLENIIRDADTKIAITHNNMRDRLIKMATPNLPEGLIEFKSFDDLMTPESVEPKATTGDELVFLQYTSGSTGAPKGVMVSHYNLISNEIILSSSFRIHDKSVICSWLPLFHDMGLIGCLLHAVYYGVKIVFMTPNAFLQRPYRWLKALTDYKVTITGAPNFVYEMCVDKIDDEQRKSIDLTHLDILFNGAEPIRATSLKRFTETYSKHGFTADAWMPCYGSAEATLIISGLTGRYEPTYLQVDREQYEQGQIIDAQDDKQAAELVASGTPLIEGSVAIVDLETNQRVPDRTIGEIFVTSPCVTLGYWNNEKATKEAYSNVIAGEDESVTYLDSGDLGFIDQGELFITGRTKDLLIFNGRNLFPQDIEACSEACHDALKPGRCAAVSAYIDDSERLILVHEVQRTHVKSINADEVIEKIRIAVYRELAVPVYAVALIEPATTPMTSSGKIRRQTCRLQYLNNELSLVALWDETMKSAKTQFDK